jgi:hypothetical protein
MVYYGSKDIKKCQEYEMSFLMKAIMNRYKKPPTKIIYSKKNDAYYVVTDDSSKKAV